MNICGYVKYAYKTYIEISLWQGYTASNRRPRGQWFQSAKVQVQFLQG